MLYCYGGPSNGKIVLDKPESYTTIQVSASPVVIAAVYKNVDATSPEMQRKIADEAIPAVTAFQARLARDFFKRNAIRKADPSDPHKDE
jgi:hypothetical protein